MDSAKVFMSGKSQAIRLPFAYRIKADEVYIRRNPELGIIELSSKPFDWTGFFKDVEKEPVPVGFMDKPIQAAE
jgi:antitoxin VapB